MENFKRERIFKYISRNCHSRLSSLEKCRRTPEHTPVKCNAQLKFNRKKKKKNPLSLSP